MRDEFDALIDDAVKSYAGAEPSPALAAGILRRTQQEALPQRKGWKLALAFAAPAAAAGALALVLLVGRLSLPQGPSAVAIVPAVPEVRASELKPVKAEPRRARAHRRRFEAVRPLPAPYTKQELALLAFVEQHPKEAAEIAKAQNRPLKPLIQQPITISHLEIAPLTIASIDQEK